MHPKRQSSMASITIADRLVRCVLIDFSFSIVIVHNREVQLLAVDSGNDFKIVFVSGNGLNDILDGIAAVKIPPHL